MRPDGAIKLWDKYFVPMIAEEKIKERIQEMALRISRDYAGKRPFFIAVLNGSFLFAADLLRGIDNSCEICFVKYQSYQGTESSGKLDKLIGLTGDIYGRNVIVLEDIVDTGLTLSLLFEELITKEPLSIRTASMLYKPNKLKYSIKPDYIGFEIANDFVVGYGLDYNGLGRNLSAVYRLKEEI